MRSMRGQAAKKRDGPAAQHLILASRGSAAACVPTGRPRLQLPAPIPIRHNGKQALFMFSKQCFQSNAHQCRSTKYSPT